MDKITQIGMDTSKNVFQLHGVNSAEEPILRKKLTRKRMVEFFKSQPPTVVAIEACGGSHHLAQLLGSFGHTVKLIAPHLVKPYVKRGKNDAADAEALCEAMSRPTMRFVPAKSAEHRAALMMIGMRNRLIHIRRQRVNQMRDFRHWRWHVDELHVTISGEMHYLWRAVDHEGEVLESYVTKKRDKSEALRFLQKALKRHGKVEFIVTNGLRSYPAVMRELGDPDRREMGAS